jgi:hypothetical protein
MEPACGDGKDKRQRSQDKSLKKPDDREDDSIGLRAESTSNHYFQNIS